MSFYPVDLKLADTDLKVGPSDSVNVVGFPFGETQAGGLAIWKIGTVASDPDIDFFGHPVFLIDATTRPGMSGSPVYERRFGQIVSSSGNMEVVPEMRTRFLGIYSAQAAPAELGWVWKAAAVKALYDSLP